MKKTMAIILVALMVVPFGIFATTPASAADIPAEPTFVDTHKVVYLSSLSSGVVTCIHCNDNAENKKDGSTDANCYTSITSARNTLIEANGGTFVIAGQARLGTAFTFTAATNPIVITGKFGDRDYRLDKLDTDDTEQRGSFNLYDTRLLTMEGAYIFENLDFLSYGTNTTTATMKINGKVVMADTVKVGCKYNYEGAAPQIEVSEGGYLYLHTSGFSAYTGTGTIVLDRALVTAGKVTADTFSSFIAGGGKVVAQDGTAIFETNTQPGPNTDGTETSADSVVDSTPITNAPETDKATDKATEKVTDKVTDKATEKVTEKVTAAVESTAKADADSTTDIGQKEDVDSFPVWIIIVAVVAVAAAVVAVVIIKKKKAE